MMSRMMMRKKKSFHQQAGVRESLQVQVLATSYQTPDQILTSNNLKHRHNLQCLHLVEAVPVVEEVFLEDLANLYQINKICSDK